MVRWFLACSATSLLLIALLKLNHCAWQCISVSVCLPLWLVCTHTHSCEKTGLNQEVGQHINMQPAPYSDYHLNRAQGQWVHLCPTVTAQLLNDLKNFPQTLLLCYFPPQASIVRLVSVHSWAKATKPLGEAQTFQSRWNIFSSRGPVFTSVQVARGRPVFIGSHSRPCICNHATTEICFAFPLNAPHVHWLHRKCIIFTVCTGSCQLGLRDVTKNHD